MQCWLVALCIISEVRPLWHLYLMHFQQCVLSWGGKGGMIEKDTEGLMGGEYLRTEPNRLRFLVLFTSLIARNLDEAEPWFILAFMQLSRLLTNVSDHGGSSDWRLLWWVIILLPLILMAGRWHCLLGNKAGYICDIPGFYIPNLMAELHLKINLHSSEGYDVDGVAYVDVIMPFALIWYCCEQKAFGLGIKGWARVKVWLVPQLHVQLIQQEDVRSAKAEWRTIKGSVTR